MKRSLCTFLVLAVACASRADVIAVNPPFGPPPDSLGPYQMIEFPPDPQPLSAEVGSVPSPFNQPLVFSEPMIHLNREAGMGPWPVWLNPDFYNKWQGGVTLLLPPDTRAFLFYARTNFDGIYIAATADGETTLELPTAFQAPNCFGFYVDTPEETIETIHILQDNWDSRNLVLGHFEIAIPEPASGLLFLLAAGTAARRVRRWPA